MEEYLEVRLFRRLNRALELTQDAQAALPKLREGFQCLAEAVEALTRGPHFSHVALALDAAADGLGVALTMEPLAAADLAAGRLIAPFELRIPLSSAYYVVCREARANQPHIAASRQWLLAEAGAAERRGTRKRHPKTRTARA